VEALCRHADWYPILCPASIADEGAIDLALVARQPLYCNATKIADQEVPLTASSLGSSLTIAMADFARPRNVNSAIERD